MLPVLYLLILLNSVDGANVNMAWLAPIEEAMVDNTQMTSAGSSMGGLAMAVNTLEAAGGDTYTVYHQDSKCNSKDSVIAMYDILINQSITLDVILGPPCSDAMAPVGELAGYRDLPIMGYLSDGPSFTDKVYYNSLVRLLPPISAIVQGLSEFLTLFEWTTVEVISTTGSPYSGMVQSLKVMDESEDNPLNVVRFRQDVSVGASEEEISLIYADVKKKARIVILCIPGSELRTWLLVASDEGMTSGDYVFFFLSVDIVTPAILQGSGEAGWSAGDDRDDEARQAYENLLLLLFAPQDMSSITSYSTEADAAAQTWTNRITGVTPQPSDVYSAYLHDAVILYTKLVAEVSPSDSGTSILDASRGRHFSGSEWATGDVYLDASGDRDPDFQLVDLREDGAFASVMTTSHKLRGGAYEREIEINEDIIWGDGSRGLENKPPDEPHCGFDGEKCTDLIPYIVPPVVVVVVLIIAVILYFIYRRWQVEQSIKEMAWRINYEQLEWSDKHKATSGSMFLRGSKTSSVGRSERHLVSSRHNSHGQVSRMDASSQHSGEDGGQVFIETAGLKGSTIAVKRMRKARVKIDRALMVEMRGMLELKHEKLAGFVGATTEPPDICEVWEYCSKGSLQDVIWNENIKLDDMFRFSITIDILKGLKYLHDSPLKLHGRVKSSNCVVDARWTCKLSDYGLFNYREGVEADPDMSDYKYNYGLFWTAPELLRLDHHGSHGYQPVGRDGMSQEGDVYACAVILKELFSRSGPYTEYDEMDPSEIIDAIKQEPATHTSAFRPDLSEVKASERMLTLIKQCWDERPSERPSVNHALKDAQKINPFKSANVMDNMIKMMERYTNSLEEIVGERTEQVTEEKKKSEDLLYRMLPRAVGEQLKKGLVFDAEEYESVSMYFSDIVSFTALAAQSTPLQVVSMLNGLYTIFDSVIAQHDVYKVETIGDAYMLVSGLPVRNGDNHAIEITNCAMDLLTVVMGYKVQHVENYQLKIRIGLHTGPVVAGVVGLTMPRYCLFGEQVNQASKMESGGKPMRVHLSQELYNILSTFSGYHLAERVQTDPKTGARQTSYFVVQRDGRTQPFPDYDELAVDDDPPTRKLPVTRGKEFRSDSLRPSVESGFYDSDGVSRKASTIEESSKLQNISEKSLSVGSTEIRHKLNDEVTGSHGDVTSERKRKGGVVDGSKARAWEEPNIHTKAETDVNELNADNANVHEANDFNDANDNDANVNEEDYYLKHYVNEVDRPNIVSNSNEQDASETQYVNEAAVSEVDLKHIGDSPHRTDDMVTDNMLMSDKNSSVGRMRKGDTSGDNMPGRQGEVNHDSRGEDEGISGTIPDLLQDSPGKTNAQDDITDQPIREHGNGHVIVGDEREAGQMTETADEDRARKHKKEKKRKKKRKKESRSTERSEAYVHRSDELHQQEPRVHHADDSEDHHHINRINNTAVDQGDAVQLEQKQPHQLSSVVQDDNHVSQETKRRHRHRHRGEKDSEGHRHHRGESEENGDGLNSSSDRKRHRHRRHRDVSEEDKGQTEGQTEGHHEVPREDGRRRHHRRHREVSKEIEGQGEDGDILDTKQDGEHHGGGRDRTEDHTEGHNPEGKHHGTARDASEGHTKGHNGTGVEAWQEVTPGDDTNQERRERKKKKKKHRHHDDEGQRSSSRHRKHRQRSAEREGRTDPEQKATDDMTQRPSTCPAGRSNEVRGHVTSPERRGHVILAKTDNKVVDGLEKLHLPQPFPDNGFTDDHSEI